MPRGSEAFRVMFITRGLLQAETLRSTPEHTRRAPEVVISIVPKTGLHGGEPSGQTWPMARYTPDRELTVPTEGVKPRPAVEEPRLTQEGTELPHNGP
jgi:hypothetical protein